MIRFGISLLDVLYLLHETTHGIFGENYVADHDNVNFCCDLISTLVETRRVLDRELNAMDISKAWADHVSESGLPVSEEIYSRCMTIVQNKLNLQIIDYHKNISIIKSDGHLVFIEIETGE